MHKKKNAAQPNKIDTTPSPRIHYEKIGETEWPLQEVVLDVFDDVRLWPDNPRIQAVVQAKEIGTDDELTEALRKTPGYDQLRKSIEDLGQMEAIYVWKGPKSEKYLVYEGATRVAVLRDLSLKHKSGPKANNYTRVKAKLLPPHFGERERVILLARIHVLGSGVRAWTRYTQAKFIWDHVSDNKDHKPLLSVTQMANYMGKSASWVQRLRDAYEFTLRFLEHVEGAEGVKVAMEEFSTLEEIMKAPLIGPKLREYDKNEFDSLRTEVFEMVRNEVFKEYRDARFLKEFYEDPEKWALLKTGEKHIANRLANEVKTSVNSVKAKIGSLEQSIQRALERPDHGLDDDDIEHLRRSISRIREHVHQGVRPFRVALQEVTRHLSEASMADVKSLEADEFTAFEEAREYFEGLVEKHGKSGKAA